MKTSGCFIKNNFFASLHEENLSDIPVLQGTFGPQHDIKTHPQTHSTTRHILYFNESS